MILAATKLPYHGLKDEQEIKNQVMFAMIAADNGSRKDLGIPMGVCFNLYRTSIIKGYRLQFPSEKVAISEDIFFNLEYLNLCKTAFFTEEAGYFYRYNPKSITKSFDEYQEKRIEIFYKQLLACTEKLKMSGDVKYRIERCIVAKTRGLLAAVVRSSYNRRAKIMKIRGILNKQWLSELLKNYKMPDYRISLKITTLCMKYGCIYTLYLIFCVREWMTQK